MYGITVFTPTYNRKHTLRRVYDSIVIQSARIPLEWIVVDDGSTDGTEELIKEFIDERKIDIKYIRQVNKGKYIARNVAIIYSQYNIFWTIDSDDYLLTNAINHVIDVWSSKDIEKNEKCAGILAPFDEKRTTDIKVKRSNLIDLYNRYSFKGEATIIWKTDVIKRFLPPVIANDKFLLESVYMRRIDAYYYYECINTRLEHREYYEDGLTANIVDVTDNNLLANLYALKNDAVYLPGIWERSNQYLKYLIKAKKVANDYLFPELVVSKKIRILTQLRYFYRNICKKSDRDLFGI